jgi:hypothetical protein
MLSSSKGSDLAMIVRGAVADYASAYSTIPLYFAENTSNADNLVFMFVDIDRAKQPDTITVQSVAELVVMARVVKDRVIIETDKISNKPVHKALLQCGVPRDHITLAYLGETMPSTSGE